MIWRAFNPTNPEHMATFRDIERGVDAIVRARRNKRSRLARLCSWIWTKTTPHQGAAT